MNINFFKSVTIAFTVFCLIGLSDAQFGQNESEAEEGGLLYSLLHPLKETIDRTSGQLLNTVTNLTASVNQSGLTLPLEAQIANTVLLVDSTQNALVTRLGTLLQLIPNLMGGALGQLIGSMNGVGSLLTAVIAPLSDLTLGLDLDMLDLVGVLSNQTGPRVPTLLNNAGGLVRGLTDNVGTLSNYLTNSITGILKDESIRNEAAPLAQLLNEVVQSLGSVTEKTVNLMSTRNLPQNVNSMLNGVMSSINGTLDSTLKEVRSILDNASNGTNSQTVTNTLNGLVRRLEGMIQQISNRNTSPSSGTTTTSTTTAAPGFLDI